MTEHEVVIDWQGADSQRSSIIALAESLEGVEHEDTEDGLRFVFQINGIERPENDGGWISRRVRQDRTRLEFDIQNHRCMIRDHQPPFSHDFRMFHQ